MASSSTATTAPQPGSFTFPPLYAFPPFFTLQPVLASRKKQLDVWCDLVLAYFHHHRLFYLEVSQASTMPLFSNAAINRKLTPDGLSAVLAALESQGRLVWEQAKVKALIFWRTPSEWAGLVADWVERTGMPGTVCTLYELTQGEATQSEAFHGLPVPVLLPALEVLQERGKAEIFQSDNPDEVGVKFF
eukprot:gnl/Hemi2/26831_TR9026_c0_g1_i1.p1 gnl/Hemi2/26831_TR9026_c0_g1~~gnl/Hemi2/26831_TR9026_c0_g1_i1.p1  ORF type:complete len:189 (+),score=75.07 gnl/Hemi2/26831_TR9026_c0_g1_i1:44-610(+)